MRERWLKDLFEEADKSGDGALDIKEVLQMMHRLNVGVSSKVLKQKFKVGMGNNLLCSLVEVPVGVLI